MFSNDKNVETIGQLAEVVKHYIGLQTEYVKLDVIEKVVRLLTLAVMMLVLAVILLLTLTYLSFAAAHAMAPFVGLPWAFCIVAGVHLLILLICFLFKKRWIERPLVKFLANLLME